LIIKNKDKRIKNEKLKIKNSIRSMASFQKDSAFISSLSRHLFWDVDINTLDTQKHSKAIIKKVLLYGLISDWNKIQQYYSLNRIIDEVKSDREIDKKTASFLAAISDTPKTEFLCYSQKQPYPKHWNF
jgi:uncharacterized protein DUF6922